MELPVVRYRRSARASSSWRLRAVLAALSITAGPVLAGLGTAVPALASGYSVIATIPIAAPNGAPAVDPVTGLVYVPDGDALTIVDAATNTVTGSIPLGAGNGGSVAVDPGTDTGYVANGSPQTVSVVDLATRAVTATIPLSAAPETITEDPFTHTVFTTDSADSTTSSNVSVIDEATNSVTTTIPLEFADGFLAGAGVDPASGMLYVSACDTIFCDSGTLWGVSEATNHVTSDITTLSYPAGVAADQETGHVFLALPQGNEVSVIDEATAAQTASIDVGNNDDYVAVDPVARTAYVTNLLDNTVSVIDEATDSVVATVPVGAEPAWDTVDPVTHDAYVVNSEGSSVTVIGGAEPDSSCWSDLGVCGYPDAETTGVPGPVALKTVPGQVSSGPGWHFDPRGFVQVTGAGANLTGLLIPYNVNISAPNVTLDDDLITAGIITGASLHGRVAANPAPDPATSIAVTLRHASDVTIENTTIDGLGPNDTLWAGVKDITGDAAGLRVLGDNIADTSVAVQADAGLIYGNYLHSELPGTGKVGGVESDNGSSPLVIEHNTISVGTSRASAVGLFSGSRPQANRYIDGNFLAGGGYVIYGGNTVAQPSSNIQVTGNRFSRAFYPQGGFYGPVAHYRSAGPENAWYGNFWDGTLAPVPAP
jgi:YVTN family beta-propeller protein